MWRICKVRPHENPHVDLCQADCRDVAQDILSVVVEGPEEDAVYEVYTDDKEPLEEEGQTSRVEDEVDEDAYKEVIEHHEESL